jgi:hypothetical protein
MYRLAVVSILAWLSISPEMVWGQTMPLFIRCRVDLAITLKNEVVRRETEYRYKIDLSSVYQMEGGQDKWSPPELTKFRMAWNGDTEIKFNYENPGNIGSKEIISIDRITGKISGTYAAWGFGQLTTSSEMHGQCQKDEPWSISKQF